MDTLEALGDDRTNAKQLSALCGPVPRRAGAIFFTAENDCRNLKITILHGRIIDRQLLSGWLEQGISPFGKAAVIPRRKHKIPDAHIGKRASYHDLVVAPAGAVALEAGLRHAVLDQIST